MKITSTIVALLLVVLTALGQTNITNGEYWFNSQGDNRQPISLTSGKTVNLSTQVDTETLYDGLHTVTLRFVDDSSRWSSPVTRFFIKQNNTITTNPSEITAVEYWFDSDPSTKTHQPVTGNTSYQFNDLIEATDLYNGLHTMHVRFKEASGRWSSVISRFFIKTDASTTIQSPNITAVQFWFDSDLATSTIMPTEPNTTVSILEKIALNEMYFGLHTIHIRARDSNQKWSPVVSRFFIHSNTITTTDNNLLTSMEYWFDTNLNSKVTAPIDATSQLVFLDNIATSELRNGLHTLHCRFKDSQQQWSSTISRFFIRMDTMLVADNNRISALEYWFDNEIAASESVRLSGKNANLLAQLNTESLANGLHTVSMRFKDSIGNYSSTISQFFIKQTPQSNTNTIVSYRYWLTDSIIHTVALDEAAHDIILLDTLNLKLYSGGEYILNMQFKDSIGLWSSTISDSINKLYHPFAQLNFDKTEGCPGTMVRFTAVVADADSVIWNFADGDNKGGLDVQHLFNSSGTYPITASLTDTTGAVVATFNTDSDITIHPIPLLNLIDSITLLNNQIKTIDAGNTFSSYSWNGVMGDQTFQLSALDLGVGTHTLTLKVSSNYGCINSDTITITVQKPVGIDKKEPIELKLYPNPASHFIRIQWGDSNIKALSASLIDANGRVVIKGTKIVSDQPINISNLKPGQYFVLLKVANTIQSIPILIE